MVYKSRAQINHEDNILALKTAMIFMTIFLVMAFSNMLNKGLFSLELVISVFFVALIICVGIFIFTKLALAFK
jgi:hypothetical protein